MDSEGERRTVRGGAHTEVYGFVFWLTSFFCYVGYLLWALLPQAWVEGFGVTYAPSRYWAVAMPAYLSSTCVLLLFSYWGINMTSVTPLHSKLTVGDDVSVGSGEEPIEDIPIEKLNEMLYSNCTQCLPCNTSWKSKHSRAKRHNREEEMEGKDKQK